MYKTADELVDNYLSSRQATKTASLLAFSPKELAEIISGTTDKSSKKYKSSLRQAYLYRQGKRTPSKNTAALLRDALRSKPQKLDRSIAGLTGKLSLKGKFIKSSDRRDRQIEIKINISDYMGLTGDELQEQFFYDYGVDGAYFESPSVNFSL
jgi:hypothetical protein